MHQVIKEYNDGLKEFKIEKDARPDSSEQQVKALLQVMKSPTVMTRPNDRVDYLEEKMYKLPNNFSQLALFLKQKKERSKQGGTTNHHSKIVAHFVFESGTKLVSVIVTRIKILAVANVRS